MPVYRYTAASNTFLAGAVHAYVQLWAGGGAGGAATGNPSAAGGGAGAITRRELY